MEDEDHYELDDSEVEAAMPPISLMQTARDILARPISQQELARAWDRSTHLPTEEGRVAACLDRLVSDSCAAFEAARETAVSAHRVQAPAQPASSPMPQSQSRTARKIIDLSMDDDDMPPVRKQIKRRRPSHDDEGRPEPSSIATGPGTSRTVNDGRAAKVRKDNKDAAVPQWLLDQFAAVSDQNLAAATVAYAPPRTQPLSTASQDTQVPAAPSVKAPFEEVPALIEEPSPLAQVLNIIPDVDTDHAQKLISRYSDNAATCVEQVIDALLADRTYPRAKPSESTTEKGKGTAPGEDDLLTKLKAYLDKDTRARMERIPTFTYRETALEYLFEEFSDIPLPFIRNVFANNNLYWAPSFIELTRMSNEAVPPYRPLKTARKSKGKGAALPQDPVLTAERECYYAKVARDQAEKDAKLALEKQEQEEIAQGAVFECGCCFDDVALSRMVQCIDAHLFCIDCARRNAENILGNRGSEITCMDQDGCNAAFSDDVLSRILKTPQMLLLEKIRTEKAVQAAGLDDLSNCPHCSFGCVIDNPDERLFYCLNDGCKKVTCRQCKKPDHLPKTCEEYAADLKTDTIHRVEEAMTEALLKRCPKCSTAVLKEEGCNKMRCTRCNILFCYVCAKEISGYEHFDQRSLPPGSSTSGGKCRLWDDDRMREYERVEAARAEAIAEIRKEKGDPDAIVSEEDLEKLGLQKPEPRQLGHAYVPVNRQYRYPEPAVAPGRAADPQAQRRAQQINGHNAILEVVNGNWQAYLAEVARIRQGVMQGLQFAGGGAREDAARVYADYWRTVLAGTGREDALPQPVLVPARQAQVPVVVPPVPQPVIIPAVPQIAPQPFVPAAARARRRVRGGPA